MLHTPYPTVFMFHTQKKAAAAAAWSSRELRGGGAEGSADELGEANDVAPAGARKRTPAALRRVWPAARGCRGPE